MLRNHGKGCCSVLMCEAGLLDIRVLRASPALFHGGARRSPSNWHPHGFNGEVNPVLRPSRMEDQKLERLQTRHDIAWEVLRLVAAQWAGRTQTQSCTGTALGQASVLPAPPARHTHILYCVQRGSRVIRAAEDWSAARVHFFFLFLVFCPEGLGSEM